MENSPEQLFGSWQMLQDEPSVAKIVLIQPRTNCNTLNFWRFFLCDFDERVTNNSSANIGAGTFEERVDQVLENKRRLADDVLDVETLNITNMSNQELCNLFTLERPTFWA